METIPGGCYQNADGNGYHDANGNPVSKENVAKFLALQASSLGLGALDPAPVDELALLKQQLADLQAQLAARAKPEAEAPTPEDSDGIDLQRLIDETENRAKKKSK